MIPCLHGSEINPFSSFNYCIAVFIVHMNMYTHKHSCSHAMITKSHLYNTTSPVCALGTCSLLHLHIHVFSTKMEGQISNLSSRPAVSKLLWCWRINVLWCSHFIHCPQIKVSTETWEFTLNTACHWSPLTITIVPLHINCFLWQPGLNLAICQTWVVILNIDLSLCFVNNGIRK